jgi:hypothetical protein
MDEFRRRDDAKMRAERARDRAAAAELLAKSAKNDERRTAHLRAMQYHRAAVSLHEDAVKLQRQHPR